MKIPLTALLIFTYIISFSQTVYMKVNKTDGSYELYNIEDIRKLTFSNLITDNPEQFHTIMNNFSILKSYPNPFSNSTTIKYEMPDNGNIDIKIFDINGKFVRTLYSGIQDKGLHKISWDSKNNTGNKVPDGIYICKVKYDGKLFTNKIIYLN